MTSLADPPDLTAYLQRTVDIATAILLLDAASGIIRSHVGWSITQETGVVLTTQGTGSDVIWLPTKNLTAVTSVVEDGVTLTADTQYRWTTTGRLRRLAGRWLCTERSVVVTYTHGYATVPSDVKGVCLTLAGRMFGNPEGFRQWSVGGVSVTVAGDATGITGMLNEGEMSQLDPYTILVVA